MPALQGDGERAAKLVEGGAEAASGDAGRRKTVGEFGEVALGLASPVEEGGEAGVG